MTTHTNRCTLPADHHSACAGKPIRELVAERKAMAEADQPEHMPETEVWCDPTKATCYLATGHNGKCATAPQPVPNELYAVLAILRKKAKTVHVFDEWDTGFAAGVDASARIVARYIEEHGGKGTS